ncbi:transglutaminase-like domain-containing protein [Altererythrobacter sp. MF3-039]|uniref:transglutaminase-like domain-containing protein n=1 Tax=Altererythrobacter sp. MF3-039 TaxID=3252901 RepID=UPI00390C8273
MTIRIQTNFTFQCDQPTDVMLQFEAADIPEQHLHEVSSKIFANENFARVPAQDDIGERIWLNAEGRIDIAYTAQVEIERMTPSVSGLDKLRPRDLPGDTIKYLFDSRYCQADRLQSFVEAEFGDLEGGARIAAFRDWIAEHLTYEPGSSNANTTALDSFVERRGICRDFAHVMIALSRASAIPARYVACYAPGVTPQDFHAVAEVFLKDGDGRAGGAWHLVDATGMAEAAETVKIGVGRDAADVSFLTSFGSIQLLDQQVNVITG